MGLQSRAIAIIPAAGSGERMRLPESKLLCRIDGQPILAKTLKVFSESKLFDSILVPCRDRDKDNFASSAASLDTPIQFFTGGAIRQESVKIALQRIANSNLEKENLLVLVHDAARCFVTPELIERSLLAAREHRAISAAVSCIDTVYQADEKSRILIPLLERSNLRSIQTPQAFEFQILWKAHSEAALHSASDDAGLVAAIHPVVLIEGERSNYKITTIEDLNRALGQGSGC